HGLTYVGSPVRVSQSDVFLDRTLALAQDPEAWPVLVHCHGCMDRTPAWAGIYKFVVEGRPLEEIFQFIEQHRGYRPKATVTLLYNRVLARLAPDRVAKDPTARLLRENARGTVDPYYADLEREQEREQMNLEASTRVSRGGRSGSPDRPSLTPRR
ncbi:MAG: protein tyrosine phosphatase, partial [Isosphaeraceae bacterium]